MHFRDDRRRRLLNEEILGAAAREEEAPPPPPPPDASARSTSRRPALARYAKAADMIHQPRITDLVPQRKLTLCLLVFFGLGITTGLEALYWYMPHLASATQGRVAQVDAEHEAEHDAQQNTPQHPPKKKPKPKVKDGRIAAFDLDGEGSLGAGFSAAMLALAGLTAVLIYTLRRHRLDDYGGFYRLWLWAAACWFVMALDEACTLHEAFKEMMVYLTGQRIYGDGSMWWVIAYGGVLGLVGPLVLWDMRRCPFASLSFVVTGVLFAVAVAAQLGLVVPAAGTRTWSGDLFNSSVASPFRVEVMLEEGCEMLGDLCLLLSMVLYARQIIREIDGTAGRESRRAKRKAGKPAEEKSATKPSAKPAQGAISTAATTAVSAATVAAAKVETRPGGGQVRKDPPHATPSGPLAKTIAPATNKSKVDRKGGRG
jgi:hypothetical protein